MGVATTPIRVVDKGELSETISLTKDYKLRRKELNLGRLGERKDNSNLSAFHIFVQESQTDPNPNSGIATSIPHLASKEFLLFTKLVPK